MVLEELILKIISESIKSSFERPEFSGPKRIPVFLFFSFSYNCFGQVQKEDVKTDPITTNKLIVKVNLTDLLVHRYSAGLEFKICKTFSLAIDVD